MADIRRDLSGEMPVHATPERRSSQTRAAILTAFSRLVLHDGFENVSVRRVVDTAGLARSTFYEHFSCKEDALRAAMERFLVVIASCVDDDSRPTDLPAVLTHLWENRRLTDSIFSGTARAILARSLTDLIEARLRTDLHGQALMLPYRLAAIQLAESQLSLVEGWLRGRAYCPVEDMAESMHRSSRATALALRRRS